MSIPLLVTFAPPHDDAECGSVPSRRAVIRSFGSATLSDEALITALREGDMSAFETLYRTHLPSLLSFAQRYVPSRAMAQDAVHDAFTGLWVRRADVRIRTTLRAYLYWLVRNRAADLVRRSTDGGRLVASMEGQSAITMVPDDTPAGDVASAAALADIAHRLQRAFDELPERQRVALRLWWHEEMSYAEIGDVLGISDVAARKLVGKAQQKLRPIVDL